jgi:hypothetical protein
MVAMQLKKLAVAEGTGGTGAIRGCGNEKAVPGDANYL